MRNKPGSILRRLRSVRWGRVARLVSITAVVALWGCASAPTRVVPAQMSVPPATGGGSKTLVGNQQGRSSTGFSRTPSPPTSSTHYAVPGESSTPVGKGGKPLTLNAVSMPLPAFINEVYGNLLHLNFHIDQALIKRDDLVTLRVSKPVSPAHLYRIATRVLGDYGVAVTVQGNSMVQFNVAKAKGGAEPPLLVSGKTLPSVPLDNRPIFQFVPISAVSDVSVKGWLNQIYKGMGLKIQSVTTTNAVLLQGPPDVVKQAVSAISILDQPSMRGRYSVRIEPMFLSADDLAQALVKTLQAEGYSAGSSPPAGAVLVIPIKANNSVLVFASSNQVLNHVEAWAKALDHPAHNAGKNGVYFYQVENTDAASLASVVAPLIGAHSTDQGVQSQGNGVQSNGTQDSGPQSGNGRGGLPGRGGMGSSNGKQGGFGRANTGQRAARTIRGSNGQTLVVDSLNNSLIYRGSPEEWAQLRPVLQQLDSPSRMVLVQVTVAEVTLNSSQQFGVEWALRKAGIGGLSGQLSTIGGLSLGNSGLNYFPMSESGQTQALLNAFASSSRVTVLSTPSLMVESGQDASIDVGSKVPTLSSNTLSPVQSGGNSSIIQQIQYLSTGVMMKIQPVVHSGNRVSIKMDVQVSSAEPTTSSKIDSPTISQREATTTLALQDGGSVLLGGLMTSNNSKGNNRVPLLGNIPILGQLFRTNTRQKTHSELMILVVPYIISTNNQAQAITHEFMSHIKLQPSELPPTLKKASPSSASAPAPASAPTPTSGNRPTAVSSSGG